MASTEALLQIEAEALVVWPDGRLEPAWPLVAGELVTVSRVSAGRDGFVAVVHPLHVPEVFAVVPLTGVYLVGAPVPF
jgi:hypothetical protein